MDVEGRDFPTDAFVEILLRLPPTTRRRLRLVCRHWRDVIDERAPARPGEPMPLVYVVHNVGDSNARASAYVVDDLAEGQCWEVWRGGPGPVTDSDGGGGFDTRMVGTCNGLLCLCDNAQPGGAISLVNPATRESLALPPQPGSGLWARRTARYWRNSDIVTRWHEAYAFVHHPVTGRYGVVHLPAYADRTGQFGAVQVFTLGQPSWRDVPVAAAAAPAAFVTCRLDAGAAYWVTKGSEWVMSFDVEDERVATAAALPVAAAGAGHLAEVRGRLGFVVAVDEHKLAKIEVWVLGGGRGRRAWSRRYRVQVHGSPKHQLARPHFEFAHSQVVLTLDAGPRYWANTMFAHRLDGAARLQCSGLRINERKPGIELACIPRGHIRTFPYVETMEPLGVYWVPGTKAVFASL